MRTSVWTACIALFFLSLSSAGTQTEPLIFNGSFEQDADGDGAPDGWSTAGRPGIEQKLSIAIDPQRGRVAKLVCTKFEPGFPDSHAMLAQLDKVGVKAGQWYRLRLWAKAENLETGGASVSLPNRQRWSDTGLNDFFSPGDMWERFEFHFQANQDLKPEDSRFQIWFNGTGTLYLDDITLEPVDGLRREWHPQLPMMGVTNALPNSSFECGGAGWGCWAVGIPGWGGQIFQRLGIQDSQRAFHGRHSWKLSLSPKSLPVCYFDYFDPMESPVKSLLIGHEGWVPVERGQSYVFSAYVMTDRPNLTARAVVWQADGRQVDRTFSVGENWTQVQLAFTAETDFACGFVGLDLREAEKPEGSLWVDAVQWERGKEPSAFQPRETLEAQVETDKLGNVFTEPQNGLTFRLRAFNAADTAQTLNGTLTVTDYQDKSVWQQNVKLSVPAKQTAQTEYRSVLAGRRGFFRLQWKPERNSPPLAGGIGGRGFTSLRCAVIEPSNERDSAFGMNHAFSWEFLLRLSHLAGIRWWRDWSVKWHTVQPEAGGGFNFRVPDAQIQRVLDADGQVDILLPFPSAPWATKPDMEKVRAQAGNNRYLEQRLVVAYKPERLEDFAAYVRATVEHYRGKTKVFEILNEPLYTTYAVPVVFGHTTADYVALLRTAYETAKAVDPTCTIVGGIGSSPDSRWVDEFVEQGGLKWCDVMDLHTYPHRGAPDSYEGGYRKLWERMKARADAQHPTEAKPIWITEVGYYGDDDPAYTPFTVGDNTMTRAMRPSELRTSSDLVKFATIFCANGVKKIFYHAGTCSALNQNDAGNIFFEYGGAPRKMLAAQAALSRLLGPDVEFVRKWTEPDWLQAFEFRSRGKTVVVLWTRKADAPPLKVPEGYRALDLMGNPLTGTQVVPTETPVYLVRD